MMETSKRLAALGSAAVGIAHDINNELTLILNYIDMTERSNPHREALLAAASRCTKMTSNLLSWSRGESVAVKPLNLQSFITEFAKKLCVPSATRFHFDLEGPPTPVFADADSLERILGNLVENAVSAMNREGEIWIIVSGFRITVLDSGPGIEPGDRDKIFEPFFSKRNKQARGRSGAGLGLAIVRELMSQQGGSVRLISEPGRGACFELRFVAAPVT